MKKMSMLWSSGKILLMIAFFTTAGLTLTNKDALDKSKLAVEDKFMTANDTFFVQRAGFLLNYLGFCFAPRPSS